MKEHLSNEYLWISIDETTDAAGRYIVLVIAGALLINSASKSYLLLCEELQEVNNTTISQVIFEMLLYGIGFNILEK